jgi:hypothetical protein
MNAMIAFIRLAVIKFIEIDLAGDVIRECVAVRMQPTRKVLAARALAVHPIESSIAFAPDESLRVSGWFVTWH